MLPVKDVVWLVFLNPGISEERLIAEREHPQAYAGLVYAEHDIRAAVAQALRYGYLMASDGVLRPGQNVRGGLL